MSAIRRRFSDFIYLYETLRIEFPTCCIPPLPDRHRMKYIKGDRFSTEFAMKRANSLERFLQRVSLHPVLQKSVHLSHFFESQDWSSYAHNVIMQDKTHYISIGGVFEGLSDAFLNSFTKINNPNMLFIDMEERIDKLDCGLVHMEKLISKMIRQKIDLEMDYNGMAFLFKQLAVLEPSLSRELTMFSEVIENTETHLKTLREYMDSVYLTFIHDLISYTNTQKQLLKQRDQKQMDVEGLTEYLIKVDLEKDRVIQGSGLLYLREKVENLTGINHEQAKQDRLKKLEKKKDKLQREIEISKIASDAFDEETIRENNIFDKIKTKEIQENFGTFANENINFYKQVIENWTKIIPELEHAKERNTINQSF
ncbi:hypothetical protein MERGE_001999 [Pneumocystis wakefieldiae]|uniref:Sorting nexin-4 n=1 Tax=Pneumocystis wakefieldiae TaxID=38082 RepID=A0A899G818_9ASCO|nr:hypothetical protein MERGE_001999 [Pneumocystis wakefieldiae]